MQDQKLGLLDQMLREEEGTFLVFSRTKHGADRISKKLERLGHDADVIHGDRSQSQRTAALKGFQNGKHRVLVATDVAARGIDVQDIAHVVNYDLPNASDDFVHRIGRTGRAGAKGVATTFVMPQEKHDARKLERELKIKFEWREADKNLEKEVRNQPLDTTAQGQNSDAARNPLLARQRSCYPDGAPTPAPTRRRREAAAASAAAARAVAADSPADATPAAADPAQTAAPAAAPAAAAPAQPAAVNNKIPIALRSACQPAAERICVQRRFILSHKPSLWVDTWSLPQVCSLDRHNSLCLTCCLGYEKFKLILSFY